MPWKRRPFNGGQFSRALNSADLREVARRRVPGFAFEYVEGGAEDEVTLRGNRRPRMYSGTSCRTSPARWQS